MIDVVQKHRTDRRGENTLVRNRQKKGKAGSRLEKLAAERGC